MPEVLAQVNFILQETRVEFDATLRVVRTELADALAANAKLTSNVQALYQAVQVLQDQPAQPARRGRPEYRDDRGYHEHYYDDDRQFRGRGDRDLRDVHGYRRDPRSRSPRPRSREVQRPYQRALSPVPTPYAPSQPAAARTMSDAMGIPFDAAPDLRNVQNTEPRMRPLDAVAPRAPIAPAMAAPVMPEPALIEGAAPPGCRMYGVQICQHEASLPPRSDIPSLAARGLGRICDVSAEFLAALAKHEVEGDDEGRLYRRQDRYDPGVVPCAYVGHIANMEEATVNMSAEAFSAWMVAQSQSCHIQNTYGISVLSPAFVRRQRKAVQQT